MEEFPKSLDQRDRIHRGQKRSDQVLLLLILIRSECQYFSVSTCFFCFASFRSDSKPDSSNKSECSSHSQAQTNYDMFAEQQLSRSQQQMGNREIQNLINSHLEASKIGRHIADTALDTKKTNCNIDNAAPTRNQHDAVAEVIPVVRYNKHKEIVLGINITINLDSHLNQGYQLVVGCRVYVSISIFFFFVTSHKSSNVRMDLFDDFVLPCQLIFTTRVIKK